MPLTDQPPLATFVAGLAVGSGGSLADLRAVAARLTAAADAWEEEGNSET